MNSLPIIFNSQPDAFIFYYNDEIITHEKFELDVIRVSENIASHKYAINLCADRYLFAVGFVACMLRKQISLMPASHAEKEIETLENDYADTQRFNDKLIKTLLKENIDTLKESSFPKELDSERLVAIIFTSGSTGKPKANLKYWGSLVDSAKRVALQLNFNKFSQHTLVATVPPQHMYGFEMTIIFPLVIGVCVHNSRPFFPEDIRHTLEKVQSPVVLVTTPIHLRACTQTELSWPNIDFALSATAPLSRQLAEDVERQLQTTVREIYGCSETGVIATRTTVKDSNWTLLSKYKFTKKNDGLCLVTPLSNEEIYLSDMIKQINEQQFQLIGRQSDLVKIAGKRGSLNDLKIKLGALDGVEDAVFFIPEENPDEKARLAALVVAPNLNIREITSFFKKQTDPAFMPRPLIIVEKLPYNESGKLPRKSLIDLFKKSRNTLKDSA